MQGVGDVFYHDDAAVGSLAQCECLVHGIRDQYVPAMAGGHFSGTLSDGMRHYGHDITAVFYAQGYCVSLRSAMVQVDFYELEKERI